MKKKAFIKYTKQGKLVLNNMIVTNGPVPKNGIYREVPMDLCCDQSGCPVSILDIQIVQNPSGDPCNDREGIYQITGDFSGLSIRWSVINITNPANLATITAGQGTDTATIFFQSAPSGNNYKVMVIVEDGNNVPVYVGMLQQSLSACISI